MVSHGILKALSQLEINVDLLSRGIVVVQFLSISLCLLLVNDLMSTVCLFPFANFQLLASVFIP